MPAGSSRWCLSSSTARASSIHELSYLGGQGQNQLYRGGPGQVHEDFQAEEACNVPAGVVFHQGQCSGPHCSYGAGTDHRQGHPDDWARALFTGTGTHRRITAKGIQMIGHLLYSPELAPTGFFLFPMVKKELAGLSLTQETFKKSWEGVVRLRQRGLRHHLQSMD